MTRKKLSFGISISAFNGTIALGSGIALLVMGLYYSNHFIEVVISLLASANFLYFSGLMFSLYNIEFDDKNIYVKKLKEERAIPIDQVETIEPISKNFNLFYLVTKDKNKYMFSTETSRYLYNPNAKSKAQELHTMLIHSSRTRTNLS